jgi:hypothetical protein
MPTRCGALLISAACTPTTGGRIRSMPSSTMLSGSEESTLRSRLFTVDITILYEFRLVAFNENLRSSKKDHL